MKKKTDVFPSLLLKFPSMRPVMKAGRFYLACLPPAAIPGYMV